MPRGCVVFLKKIPNECMEKAEGLAFVFFCSRLVKKISWQAPKAAEGIREGLAGKAAAAARRAEGCGVTAQPPVAFIPRWCSPAFVLVPSSQAHHGAPKLFPEPKASQKSPSPSCPALGSRWLITACAPPAQHPNPAASSPLSQKEGGQTNPFASCPAHCLALQNPCAGSCDGAAGFVESTSTSQG